MPFQPPINFSQKPVLPLNAQIRIKDGQIQLTIINTTDRPYILSPNTFLGTVSLSLLTCTKAPLLSSTISAHQSHIISHSFSNPSH